MGPGIRRFQEAMSFTWGRDSDLGNMGIDL
jgi:hypothetical protein